MARLLKLSLILLAIATVAFAQPKIEIENDGTLDWGTVKAEDDPLKGKIKIFNKGDQNLEISEVKPGCGCTTAPLDKDVIEPGGFATLDVTLKVGSHNGPMTKSIMVTSNDPDNKRKHIMLKCNVYKPMTYFPRYFRFARLYVGQEVSAKVIMTNNTDKPITVTGVEVTPDNFKVNMEQGTVIPANGKYTLEAVYTPTQVGRLTARVKINTDSKEMEQININGWGNVIESQ